jgi:hypothetical protein
MALGPQKYNRLVQILSTAVGSMSVALLDELTSYLDDVDNACGRLHEEDGANNVTTYEVDDIDHQESGRIDSVIDRVITHSALKRGIRFLSVCDFRQLPAVGVPSNAVPRLMSPSRNLLKWTIRDVVRSAVTHRCREGYRRRWRLFCRYEFQCIGRHHVHALVSHGDGNDTSGQSTSEQ